MGVTGGRLVWRNECTIKYGENGRKLKIDEWNRLHRAIERNIEWERERERGRDSEIERERGSVWERWRERYREKDG